VSDGRAQSILQFVDGLLIGVVPMR
jgi:hypothetical protein